MAVAQRKPAARTRTRLDVEERKHQLLAMGIRVFSERSYDEISIDDLARAAGISKGLLYHYFPTKRDFYIAALKQASSELVLRTETPGDVVPEERVRLGLETWFDFVDEHGAAYLALVRGGLGTDPEVYGILEGTRATFVERILAEVPMEKTPLLRTLLRGWLGLVEATVTEWLLHRDVPREVLIPRMILLLGQTLTLGAGEPGTRAKKASK